MNSKYTRMPWPKCASTWRQVASAPGILSASESLRHRAASRLCHFSRTPWCLALVMTSMSASSSR